MLSGRMNQSEELSTSHRRPQTQHSRKTTRSPQVSPNDPKYLHCIRPIDTRKRKLSKNSQSLRLRSNDSQKRTCPPLQSSLNEIHQQLLCLKNQYRSLKHSYNDLLKEKTAQAQQSQKLVEENVRMRRDLERARAQSEVLVQEVVRVKREAAKMVEVEVFKNKKLEETLCEKEQLIQIMKVKFGGETEDTKENSCGNGGMQEGKIIEGKVTEGKYEEVTEQKFLLTSVSSLKKNQANTQSQDSLTFSKEKQYNTYNGVRFANSPRNGFPNLLHNSDRQENSSEYRFVALEEHVFRKKMRHFVQQDNLQQSCSPQETNLVTSPEITKKRSTTAVAAAKPKRKTTASSKGEQIKRVTPNSSNLRMEGQIKRKKTTSKMEKANEKGMHR